MSKKPEPNVKSDARSLTGKKPRRKRSLKRHSPKLSGEIELLRMRVAAAESLLKKAREQASRAKRRRKLAKLLAKRARKHAKRAKANLAGARAALARAEVALIIDSNRRTAKRRIRRAKRVARSVSPTAKKRPAIPRKRRNPSHRKLPAPAAPPATPPAMPDRLEQFSVGLDAGTAQTAAPVVAAQTTP
jgi:hypothetical protein